MHPDRQRIIEDIARNPVLAHELLFASSHPNATPLFHREMIRDWHSDHPRVLTLGFRGSAKSTRAEEAIVVMACLRRIKNCVILGDNEQRATERLRSIKDKIENNEFVAELFELGRGDIWTETKVTLSNGVILQAYGAGQSLRGVKHLDARPDMIFADDLEDEESVATPLAREKTIDWFTKTVVPALAPGGRMRLAATPLHPQALAPTLARARKSWVTRTYPIMMKHPVTGAWVATWPERFPVPHVMRIKADLEEIGKGDVFVQEYMCEAVNAATQTFTPDLIRVVPRVRSWHAVYAMYDPARTTNKTSATTGKVVWSWVGRKLIVWDAFARKLMPDEIVKDIFNVDKEFNPVAIGVEETGLNEFLLQPIRTEQAARGHVVPLRPLHAPKGKLDFIRALQPYFRAGEVEFARELPELRDQLVGFPTGDIDAPNALAYALKMRLGLPIYENFSAENVAANLHGNEKSPLYLCVNSNAAATTGALCQVTHGQFLVLADWLREGDPGSVLADIVAEARPFAANVRVVAPRPHFEPYDTIGLRAAARQVPIDLQRGGEPTTGREELRALFRRTAHGQPAVQVSEAATWTLRALAGGFCRQADAQEPEANPYRVLMEGVESFAGLLRAASSDVDKDRFYDYTPEGRRYLSARAR